MKHIECISDFCGNNSTGKPGAWADIYEKDDGSKVIVLGGGWEFYAKNTPIEIPESDKHYQPFIEACNNQTDFGYAMEHWS